MTVARGDDEPELSETAARSAAAHPLHEGRGADLAVRLPVDASGRRGLHALVVRQLGLRIVRGDLLPNETLPNEDELSEQLGVSRTVVREAVKVLREKGLVEVRPRTGTRVRPRDLWNLIDGDMLAWHGELGVDRQVLLGILEVRSMLEPSAARLAAVRATPEQISNLERAVVGLEAAAAIMRRDGARAWEASLGADLAFHQGVIRACQNAVLLQFHQTIATGLRATQRRYDDNPASSEYSVPLHRRVFEAVRDRDPVSAERWMSEIIRLTAAYVDHWTT
jgi:DNA-binding FadR family transcriptional regulator